MNGRAVGACRKRGKNGKMTREWKDFCLVADVENPRARELALEKRSEKDKKQEEKR